MQELDIVSLADDDGKINDRNKRTIGILRELFPELSKVFKSPKMHPFKQISHTQKNETIKQKIVTKNCIRTLPHTPFSLTNYIT